MPAPEWIHDFLDLLLPGKALGLVEYMKAGVIPSDLVDVVEEYEKALQGVENGREEDRVLEE